MTDHLTIAHISDLHFSKFSFQITQFFSKRWLGNLNLLLNRKHDYVKERPFSLIEAFKQHHVTDVIVSGDVTTTSFKKEYHLIQQFTNTLKEQGCHVYLIPGNHDHYTRHAYRTKLFYNYFDSQFDKTIPYNLKDHQITGKKLSNGWWLIAIDTTLATHLYSANGYFSREIEEHLQKLLIRIPRNEKILLVNHFPFFQHESPRRRLKRGEVLEKIIKKHPNIQLYLHGHTHRRCVADLRKNGLPIILDSGSVGHRLGSFSLISLSQNQCDLDVYQWQGSNWDRIEQYHFTWDKEGQTL